MNTTSYLLLITLFLTEGGTLEAEADSESHTMRECKLEATEQEKALREEFSLTTQERGLCPFTDVKIQCKRVRNR